MKIAQIAPVIESVPPKKYGGTERVISTLTEELVKRGHEVTLFASGDSVTKAKLVSVCPQSLRAAKVPGIYGANNLSMLNIGLAYSMQNEFDIIHDHVNDMSVPTANLATTPVVMTLHGALNENNAKLFKKMNNPNYVTISKSQAVPEPGLNYIGNVYNGLDMNGYPFSDQHGGYLLFVGRISVEKGVHNAIEVAKRTKLPLIIAAKLETDYQPDVDYYKKYVEPELNDQIQWIGEVDEEERNKLMSKALCFLHPLTWSEPFGLTLIESMACGCPVLAFAMGSIPELILDGKTGFIANDIDDMVDAVRRVKNLNRIDCRIHALNKFSGEIMADGYERIYKRLLIKGEMKKISQPIYDTALFYQTSQLNNSHKIKSSIFKTMKLK